VLGSAKRLDFNSVVLLILLAFLPLIFHSSPLAFLGGYLGGKIRLLEIAFVILFPTWLFLRWRAGSPKLRFPPGTIFFVAFVIVAVVSSFLSTNPMKSLVTALSLFYAYLLLFFFFNLLENKGYVILSMKIFLVISSIVTLIGLVGLVLYWLFGIPSFAVEVYHEYLGFELVRPRSTFITSNYLLTYTGFSLVVGLALLKLKTERWIRILALIMIITVCAITAASLNRGAFVIWGTLFFGLLCFRRTILNQLLRAIFLILFLTFFLLFFFQAYINIAPVELSQNPASQQLNISISTKPSVYAYMHRVAIRLFLDHPILGTGPGLYNDYMNREEYGFNFSEYPWPGLDPHSTYLGYLAETGILGIIFVLLFLARTLWVFRDVALQDNSQAGGFGRFLLPYFSLMLIYAFFVDIMTLRFLYFAYALGFFWWGGAMEKTGRSSLPL
jgi:O-antigen ligase